MERLDVHSIRGKASSKHEIYRLLTTTGGVYMPPERDCNFRYVRGVVKGEKKFVYSADVKVTRVPFIHGLEVRDVLDFASARCNILEYLPEYEKPRNPAREWICNLVNTLYYDDFTRFVDKAIQEREKFVLKKRNLQIEMLPEFVRLFQETPYISTQKGRSNFLLREASYKYKEEIKEDMQVDNQRDLVRENKRLRDQRDGLTKKLEEVEKIEQEAGKNIEILSTLFEKGVIDKNGNILIESNS